GAGEVVQGTRTERVAQVVREAVTEALAFGEVKDPRVLGNGLVTVTHVVVTGDLRSAKVYIVVHDGDAAKACQGLSAARGFLRRLVGDRLSTKFIPELRFFVDEEFEQGQKIERLLADLREPAKKE